MRDRRRARTVRVGQVSARGIVADLRGVRVDEPLPVRFLAVVAARRPLGACPVAAVGKLGTGPHLIAMRVQQRVQLWVLDAIDRVEPHPRMRDDPRRVRARRQRDRGRRNGGGRDEDLNSTVHALEAARPVPRLPTLWPRSVSAGAKSTGLCTSPVG